MHGIHMFLHSQRRRHLASCVSCRLIVDTFSAFCDGFIVLCAKLMLSKFIHRGFAV